MEDRGGSPSFLGPVLAQLGRHLQKLTSKTPPSLQVVKHHSACFTTIRGHPHHLLSHHAEPPYDSPSPPCPAPEPRNCPTHPINPKSPAINAGKAESTLHNDPSRNHWSDHKGTAGAKGELGQMARCNRLRPVPADRQKGSLAHCPQTATGTLLQTKTRHWTGKSLEHLGTTGRLLH